MPVDFKDNRYHKPSRSPHRSKHRDHRTYEKEKTERFQKYHRRSHSRSPPTGNSYKSNYPHISHHKDSRRYQEHYKDTDKNKHYESSFSKRDHSQKRDRQKSDDSYYKLKYTRPEQRDLVKNRERNSGYDKRERSRNSPTRKRRKESSSRSRSSRSRSSSRKQTRQRQFKLYYTKHSPSDRYRQQENSKRNKQPDRDEQSYRSARFEEQKIKNSPPKIVKNEFPKPFSSHQFLQKPNYERNFPPPPQQTETEKEDKRQGNKSFFKLKSIPPPPPLIKPKLQESKQLPKKQQAQVKIEQKNAKEQTVQPVKLTISAQIKPFITQELLKPINKFDSIMKEAKQNLVIQPPKSSFLLLQTFKTMNKFQVETLELKWLGYLRKDMERYTQQREKLMEKLTDLPVQQLNITGKQFVWVKQERNQEELDLRLRFEELKKENSNLNELIRKLRFFD